MVGAAKRTAFPPPFKNGGFHADISMNKKYIELLGILSVPFNLFSILINLGFLPFFYERGYGTISLIIGLSLLIAKYIISRKITGIIGGIK